MLISADRVNRCRNVLIRRVFQHDFTKILLQLFTDTGIFKPLRYIIRIQHSEDSLHVFGIGVEHGILTGLFHIRFHPRNLLDQTVNALCVVSKAHLIVRDNVLLSHAQPEQENHGQDTCSVLSRSTVEDYRAVHKSIIGQA